MSIVIYTDRNITRKLALQRMNITGRGLADSGRKCGIGFNRPKSNSFTAKSEFDKSNRVQTVGVPFICPKDVIHKLFFSVGIPTSRSDTSAINRVPSLKPRMVKLLVLIYQSYYQLNPFTAKGEFD